MTSPEQALRYLDARAAAARSARESHAASVRERVLIALKMHVPLSAQVWLIGSLAWGGFGLHSDVDVVWTGLSSAQLLDVERALRGAAGVAVDLLEFDTLPVSFQERVVAEGIEVRGG